MLSRRNLIMMLTMFCVVLVLFLSTAVLKEYFNDYGINHFALEPRISREKVPAAAGARQHVIYAGAEDTGFYQPIQEWAEYRKMGFYETWDVLEGIARCDPENALLLLDGDVLEGNPQRLSQALTAYVQRGGTVIFCSMPSYQTIRNCDTLRRLLGIQTLRAQSLELLEYWLYKGFLLGGDVCYSFDELQPPENLDMERVIPWYDVSAGTKTYMVGYIPIEEREALGLSREDMPAVIWRSSTGDGCVFAVNGDFMQGEIALGLLDAMVYESSSYALYAVVNAQNLCVTGFPDLTSENEEQLAEVYVYNSQQLCRDILWPSLVAAANNGDWRISAFLSVRQSCESGQEPDMESFIEYLKYYNEVSAEAGMALGRMEDPDIRLSLTEDRAELASLNLSYGFSGGYIRPENEQQLSGLLRSDGYMDVFPEIRTVVRQRDSGQRIVSWLTDQITSQSVTMDGYQHTYKDNLRLKSLQTALGYSNVQADIYRVLWLESRKDSWENVAETFSSSIATHWKPFAAFDKTTISESDRRVRIFLNETITSQERQTRNGRQISIQVENFCGDAWLMLRTHGEVPKSMEGGTWKQVEEDAYLLHLTSDAAAVELQSKLSHFYYAGS